MKRSELKKVDDGITNIKLKAQHVMVIPSNELNIRWDFVGENKDGTKVYKTLQFFVDAKELANDKGWIKKHSHGMIE